MPRQKCKGACPISRPAEYRCRTCWFWKDKCAYDQVIAEAKAESGNLLGADEARRRFPHIFTDPKPDRRTEKELDDLKAMREDGR